MAQFIYLLIYLLSCLARIYNASYFVEMRKYHKYLGVPSRIDETEEDLEQDGSEWVCSV